MQQSRCVLAVAGAAVTAASFLAGLQVQIVGAELEIDPATVNRTLKGERLPVLPGPSGENPALQPSLPIGCEARFSSVRNAYANEIAGRCLAKGHVHPSPAYMPIV